MELTRKPWTWTHIDSKRVVKFLFKTDLKTPPSTPACSLNEQIPGGYWQKRRIWDL